MDDEPLKCAIGAMMAGGATRDEAWEKFREWERRQIVEHGWIGHLVFDDPDSPTGGDCHTHGLAENFDHPDLQIVFPLPREMIGEIFRNIVDLIKEGRRFADGEECPGIIQNFLVRFVAASESGRKVLRVILPDQSGNVGRTMASPYSQQYGDL